MKKKKIFISLSIIFLAILAVYLFWQNTVFLTLILVTTAFIKNKVIPIKKEFVMYIISACVGTGAESLTMFSGPWSYAITSTVNFPIWLPFLWGLAGITGITLYQGVAEG